MILAWIGAIAVGLSLGLLGSGGSILTVPILVYLVGQADKVAIASSLAIVGGIALVGAFNYALQGLVDWRQVLLFGLPGIAGTYAGAMASSLVPGAVQLLVFAGIIGLTSYTMLRPSVAESVKMSPEHSLLILISSGIGVGVITGFVGVGGGFLLVPALVILGGLGMRKAVGTSLAIIVLNAASGFYKHLAILNGQEQAGSGIDWHIIALFLGLGIAGSLLGHWLGRRVPQKKLQRFFGVFLIVMCIYILWRSAPQVF